MLIALDLSTTRTGVAKFSDTGELIERFSIVPEQSVHPYFKINFIVDSLRKHLMEASECIVEGIFLNTYSSGLHGVTGFETLARLSGAVVNEWIEIKKTIPTIFKASEARKLVGVKGTCQKAEVQLFIAAKFNFATEEQIHNLQSMIDCENAQLIEKEFTKDTWKKHMAKISTYIEGEIDLSEDEADSLLLGLSFFADKLRKK